MDRASDSRTSASLLGRLGGNPHDAAAWGEFVQRYSVRILSWCRHWQLQEADAQDVTQNVLLALARQMHSFRYDPARSFRAWLKTIAHAAWCDWLETQKRPGRGSGDSQVLELLTTVEARNELAQQLEAEYEHELLEAASARVRLRVEPHTWQAFVLTAQEGLSGAEAAARLGVRVSYLYKARQRVQAMLRAEVEKLQQEG